MADRFDPADPPEALLAFLSQRHLATLTTLRADGRAHVVPVGFTYDPVVQLARVITFATSRKARNVEERPDGQAVLCQLEGARWVSLEGSARLRRDDFAVQEAVRRYAARYRPPKERSDRVVIEVHVGRILGRLGSPA